MSHITCINEGCRNAAHHKGDPCDFCRVAKYESAALNKCGSDIKGTFCKHCGKLVTTSEQLGWLHAETQLACCGGPFKTFATPIDELIIPNPLLGDASLNKNNVLIQPICNICREGHHTEAHPLAWKYKCAVCSGNIVRSINYGLWHHADGDDKYEHLAVLSSQGIEEVEARRDNTDLSKGGVKYDVGKPALELVAPEFLLGMADVLTYGANKYLPRNWEAGMRWGRPLGALQRHLLSWMMGEEIDPESGKHHLDHAACCLMFLRAYVARKIGEDDRKRAFK